MKGRQLAIGRLEAKSAAFKRLFPKNATVERVTTGFRFTEGPVWLAAEQSLLFSDIPADQILKLTPDYRIVIFRRPSGNSNGLT